MARYRRRAPEALTETPAPEEVQPVVVPAEPEPVVEFVPPPPPANTTPTLADLRVEYERLAVEVRQVKIGSPEHKQLMEQKRIAWGRWHAAK
jgi:hypothetical protein